MRNKDFFIQWEAQMKDVASLLDYFRTYPAQMEHLEMDGLISSEELPGHQDDWIELCARFTGMEGEFFKAHWVPLQKNDYANFLDMSDPQYPIFSMSFFQYEPHAYYKVVLVESVGDLMLAINDSSSVSEIKERVKVAEEQCSRDLFLKRNRYAYSGRLKVDLPGAEQITRDAKKLLLLSDREKTTVLCRNTASRIIGLLPFELEVEIVHMQVDSCVDQGLGDPTGVQTIRDLSFFILSNGYINTVSYEVRIPSKNAKAYYSDGQFELNGDSELIRGFMEVLESVLGEAASGG